MHLLLKLKEKYAIAHQALVHILRRKKIVNFRDLGEVMDKYKLKKAVRDFQELTPPKTAEVISLRKAYERTQEAYG